MFSQLNELVGSEVNFGNKSKVLIIARGNINKHSKDGANFTKVDVFKKKKFEFFEHGIINKKRLHIINILNGV